MDQSNPITTSQSVRYGDIIVQIETVCHNGIQCLFLEDVQQRFPKVTSLYIENRQLSFLRDDKGNRLEPQRIKAENDKVIDARDPEGYTNDEIHPRLDRIEEHMQRMQKINNLTLDKIHTEIKQAKVQMYELHEYTTPRYFFILPAEECKGGPINAIKKIFRFSYKLYFLCECSDDPKQLHVAPHDGYLINEPSKFIKTYGARIRTTLDIVRAVLSVGSIIIPQVENVPEFVTNTHIPVFDTLDAAKLDSVKELLDQADNYISTCTDSSLSTKTTSQNVSLEGAPLRELISYLEITDKNNSLGNLYRMITDEGHVRWVCLQHYNTVHFNDRLPEFIRQFEVLGGKFDQDTKKAIITENNLTTKNIEMLCGLLTKGFNILTLVFKNCSLEENDLNRLFDVVINRSFVLHLIISDVTIKLTSSEGICQYMSIHIKSASVEIRLPGRCQIGDMKIIARLCLQNKICRILNLHGYGDLPEYRESLLPSRQIKQGTQALIVNHINNIEFLNDILHRECALSQLKLSFWFSPPSTLSRFCEVIGKNRTLVELDIMNYNYLDDEDFIKLLTTLRRHKSLKQLSLLVYNLQPCDKKEVCLIDLLLKDSFMSRLRLSDCNISPKLTDALVQASQKLPLFTYLELYNYKINDDDKSRIQLLHTDGNLTDLTLSNEQYWCVALKEMRQQFQKAIHQYRNLELQKTIQEQERRHHINLDRKTLTDSDMEIVANDAIINQQCKQLSLEENKITSVGALILADALNNNTTLKALFINNNQLSDIGVYALARTLTVNNTTLEELDLGSNEITDEGVKHLVHMLKTNRTLVYLHLSENDITNEGVRILANAIQNDNTNIKILWLSGNKLLTDSCVKHLTEMIKHSSTLKKLFVFNCKLSDRNKGLLTKVKESKEDFYLGIK